MNVKTVKFIQDKDNSAFLYKIDILIFDLRLTCINGKICINRKAFLANVMATLSSLTFFYTEY